MAQEQANMILEAWLRGLQGAQAASQFKKEQEFRENELAERKQEHENTLNLESAHFDAQQKAAEKLFELQKSEAEANQAQKELAQVQAFQQTGITPSGAAVQPGLTPAQPYQAPVSTFNPQTGQITFPQENKVAPLTLTGAENNQVFFPGTGRTYSAPPLSSSPAALQAAAVARQQEAARINEQRVLQQEMLNRESELAKITQAEETKRYLAQINAQKDFDAKRAAAETAGRISIANIEAAERIRQSMIAATGGLSELSGGNLFGQPKGTGQGGVAITSGDGQPQFNVPGPIGSTINQSLTNIYKGTDSLERQEKVNPKLKQVISSAAAAYNVGSLTDQEVKDLKDTQLMAQAAPILHDLHILRRDSPTLINIPGTTDFKKFQSLQNQLDTLIPKIATSLSGSKRMSEPELKRYFEGYSPNRIPVISGAEPENEKYNKFVTQDLWGRAKDLVQGLPEGQQNAILSGYKFTQLPSTIITKPGGGPTKSKTIQWIRDPKTGKLVQAGGQ